MKKIFTAVIFAAASLMIGAELKMEGDFIRFSPQGRMGIPKKSGKRQAVAKRLRHVIVSLLSLVLFLSEKEAREKKNQKERRRRRFRRARRQGLRALDCATF